jgi:universal stress protein E
LEAVELSREIGRDPGTEVLYISVLDELGESADSGDTEKVLNQLQTESSEKGVRSSTKVVEGRAWLEIIHEVLRGGYDLVLVGSRNHRTRERLLGTTGTKLLRKCPCAVWVARPESDNEVKTIVVADDLTDVGSRAVQLGVSVTRLLEARLLVVHAVQFPLEHSLRRSGCPQEELDEHRRQQEDAARQTISEHLAQTDARTLNQGVRIEVTPGPPDVVIEDAIEEHSADLLVMGTIARTGIPGLLVGNTAERLLPQVTCSVLAIKPEGFESPVKLEE